MASPEGDYCSPPAERKLPPLIYQRFVEQLRAAGIRVERTIVRVAGPASGKTATLAARGLLFMDEVVVEDLPPPGELLQ
jgi:hypothetical protein